MRVKSGIFLGIFIAVLCVLLGIALWWNPVRHNDLTRSDADKQPSGGDFTLQSSHGPVALHDFRGKVVVLYFGYTLCPDVCPTSLAMIGQAFRSLQSDELKQVQGIFVSVDPQRDTLARLASYTPYFHKEIMGITGTPAQVADVAKLYGVVYHRVVDNSSPKNYIVDHTSFIYVIDRSGHLAKILPHGTTSLQIAAEIKKLLTKS